VQLHLYTLIRFYLQAVTYFTFTVYLPVRHPLAS